MSKPRVRIAAAVLSAVIGLSACSPATPTSSPPVATTSAPTSVPAASPIATVEPTTGPTVSGLLTVPTVACCRGTELDPGRYEVPRWLDIPLSVDVPAGWRVLNEPQALLFLLGRGENVQDNPSQMIVLLNATGTDTPEAIIEDIRNVPQLAEVAAPSAVTVAGLSGVQLDMAAVPNPTYEGDPAADIPPGIQFLPVIERYLAAGFAWTTSSPEARLRTIALTVGDQVLLVYLEAPPGEIEALVADAAAVLESLESLAP